MRRKVLIIRFSSIGDILLTTPVVRCVSQQVDSEVHYLTKVQYVSLLSSNPFIDKIIPFEKGESEKVIEQLKNESYDLIIDLHKSLRSKRIRLKLGVNSITFDKANFRKWLVVQTKNRKMLPKMHLVERYFESVSGIGVKNDDKGLDYHFNSSWVDFLGGIDKQSDIWGLLSSGEPFYTFVLAAAHRTKAIPIEIARLILSGVHMKVVLVGGEDYRKEAETLAEEFDFCYSLVGQTDLDGSAWVIYKSMLVITPDTGMMHMAAALRKPAISLWGNTIPEFGMYPYYPDRMENKYDQRFEVDGLKCRPCSKLGFNDCPKKHFKCMMEQDVDGIVRKAREIMTVG